MYSYFSSYNDKYHEEILRFQEPLAAESAKSHRGRGGHKLSDGPFALLDSSRRAARYGGNIIPIAAHWQCPVSDLSLFQASCGLLISTVISYTSDLRVSGLSFRKALIF